MHGGLNSPYLIVVDAGNKSDFYQAVDFARQYGANVDDILDRMIVTRTFTIHQLKTFLSLQLGKVMQRYQAKIAIIPGLLEMFDDPNISEKEAKKVISSMLRSIKTVSRQALVIASVVSGKYTDSITTSFAKRISIINGGDKRLAAVMHIDGRTQSIILCKTELVTPAYE
jgi:hypothetical protein